MASPLEAVKDSHCCHHHDQHGTLLSGILSQLHRIAHNQEDDAVIQRQILDSLLRLEVKVGGNPSETPGKPSVKVL